MGITLKSRIPEIVTEVPVGVGEAIHLGTDRIAQEAADRAPVNTGTLRESVEAGITDQGYGIKAEWYWIFSEFGTKAEAARPWMIPAVEAGRDSLLADVRAALERL